MTAAPRFQTAPGGGLYGAVWLRSAGYSAAWFLDCVCELHHVFALLRFVEFQRQRRDRGTARIGRVDRMRDRRGLEIQLRDRRKHRDQDNGNHSRPRPVPIEIPVASGESRTRVWIAKTIRT